MDLVKLDLNLLVALDALLQQRNVTRAAAQLGLGQPALSGALRRLRTHFDDELLTRTGNSYKLTPLAVRLQPRVRSVVDNLIQVFAPDGEFDIATSTRQFRLIVDDYALELLAGPIARLFEQQAPRARVAMIPATDETLRDVEVALLSNDLFLCPHGSLAGLPHEDLFSDQWQVVAATSNTALGDTVTPEVLAAQPWVVQGNTLLTEPPVITTLRGLGLEPHVAVITHSCLSVPELVAGTCRVAVLPQRLVQSVANDGIRVVTLSPGLPAIVAAMWWHPLRQHDPEHTFLCRLVAAAAASLEHR